MKILFGIILLLGSSISASAGTIYFEDLQKFHDQRVNTLIQNYGMSDDLEASVVLSPSKTAAGEDKVTEDTRIRLPGLLIGGIEEVGPENVTIFEIIQSLKNYQRAVTIVQKRSVSEEEIEAVKAGLREYLALRADEVISVQDKRFSFGNAIKNWSRDLSESVYTSLFKNQFLAWIPVALLFLFLFSTFFASSFKGIFRDLGESIEKGAESAASIGADSKELEDMMAGSEFNDVIETETDQIFEIDPLSILQKVLHLSEVTKFELYNILWSFLPSAEKQISFYELISAEADALEAEQFKKVFFEAFKLSPSVISNMKAGEFVTARELAGLHKSLVCAQLIDIDPKRERALSAVFPKHGRTLGAVIENSLDQFFSVIYYLFPDKVLEVLTSSPEASEKAALKVTEHLTRNHEQKEPNDLEIKGFMDFLENGVESVKANLIKLDEKTVRLLYSLPDSTIMNADQWTPEYKEQVLRTIPNLGWLMSDNPMKLKQFFLSLTSEEMLYVSEEHRDFESLISIIDDRGQLRVQEKIRKGRKSESRVNWAVFRVKLKKSFKYIEDDSIGTEEIFSNAA